MQLLFFLIFIPMTGGVDHFAAESKLSICNVSPCGVSCYSCKAASSNVSCYWFDRDPSRVYDKCPFLFRDNRIRGKISSFLQRLHHLLSHIWRPCTRRPSPGIETHRRTAIKLFAHTCQPLSCASHHQFFLQIHCPPPFFLCVFVLCLSSDQQVSKLCAFVFHVYLWLRYSKWRLFVTSTPSCELIRPVETR